MTESIQLKEYRPGRWAKVHPETGQVLGLATDAEADRWIRANLLDQAEPAGNGRNRRNGGHQAAELPLFAQENKGAPTGRLSSEPAAPSGDVVFVAYRDDDVTMIPVARGGRLLLFDSLDLARANAGALGVGAAVRPERLPQLCRQYGLRMPDGTGMGG